MSVLPAKQTLTCWRGGTFRSVLTLYTGATSSTPLRDLTDYTAEFRVQDPDGVDLFTLTHDLAEEGQILLGGALGTLTVLIPAFITSTLAWDSAKYELLITGPSLGDTDPILWGSFVVRGS